MNTYTCPICKDMNPLCLLVTCEERRKAARNRPAVSWSGPMGTVFMELPDSTDYAKKVKKVSK